MVMLMNKICVKGILLIATVGFFQPHYSLASEANKYFESAQGFVETHDYQSAIIQLKNALQTEPDHIESRLLLGDLSLQLGMHGAAEKEFRRAAELGASAEHWETGLAHAYLSQGKLDQLLEEILVRKTSNVSNQLAISVLRGQAHFQKNELADAYDSFQQALKIDPQYSEALLGKALIARVENEYDLALELVEQILISSPNHAQALLIRGWLSQQNDFSEGALNDFGRVIDVDPFNKSALWQRAAIYISLKKYQLALGDLDVFDKVQQNSSTSLYLRAVIAFEQGDIKKAVSHAESALSITPKHPAAQLLLGTAYYMQGRLNTAVEFLSDAYATQRNNVEIVKLLSAIKLRLGDPDTAISLLEPFRQAGDIQVLVLLGNAYMESGDSEEATAIFQDAVTISPDIAQLRTQLAIGLLSTGLDEQAIKEFELAVDLGGDLMVSEPLLVYTHMRRADYEAALVAAQSFEEKSPQNPVPLNLTGLVFLAMEKPEQAQERFEQALAIAPSFHSASINLSRLDIIRGDDTSAVARYEQILSSNPEHFEALIGLLAMARKRADTKEMEALVDRTKKAHPGSVQPGLLLVNHYIEIDQYRKAKSEIMALREQFPANPVVLNTLGRIQIQLGETDWAIRSYESWVKIEPNSPFAHQELGKALQITGDLYGALASYKNAIRLKPDFLKGHVSLASVYLAQKNLVQAMEVANQVEAENPQQAVGYRLKGLVYQAEGKHGKAVQIFSKAYAIEKSALIASALSRSYLAIQQQESAVKILRDWLDLEPEDYRVRRQLALLLHQQKQYGEAMAEYETLLNTNQTDISVLNNLAWLYWLQADKRALDISAKAYELASDQPQVIDTYGWIMLHMGNKRKALDLLNLAASQAPANPEIRFHRAKALKENGRTDEAVKELTRLLRDYSRFPEKEKATKLLEDLSSG